MKKRVLIISNSNMFTILSRVFLETNFDCDVFHLRARTEEMTRSEQFAWQVKDMHRRQLVVSGVLHSHTEFPFTERLAARLSARISQWKPDVVLVEVHTMNEAEKQLLSYLVNTFSLPTVLYSEFVHSSDVLREINSIGIRGCIWNMDKTLFIQVVNSQFEEYEGTSQQKED